MVRSYKIYKSYHTSHHNTTKNHLQISDTTFQRPATHRHSQPPSKPQGISSFQTTGVQQRADAHNLPDKHIESQSSKLQASSNAPTLTTSLQTTWNLKLPNYKRPATRRRSQPPSKPHGISSFQTTSVQQRADAHNLPANHKETQPFLPAIQRSADGSSNSRQTTLSLPP